MTHIYTKDTVAIIDNTLKGLYSNIMLIKFLLMVLH